MTDTTKERDLKVAIDGLKHSCLRLNKYQNRATVDIEDVEMVLAAFEAERQRADDLQSEQNQHDTQIAQMEGKIQLITRGFRLKTEHCEKAEEEIAALKGEQVYQIEDEDGWQDCEKEEYYSSVQSQGIPAELHRVLFTAPQKPVVTDKMALAFHFATTDGAAADDDVEDIKTGLRAALSAVFI